MTRPSALVWLSLVACTATAGSGCAGKGAGSVTTPATESDERPIVDERPLQAAGARCQGPACQCRPVDAYGKTEGMADVNASAVPAEGAIAEGMKRFELRTGRGSDQVQITVENRGALRKSGAVGTVEPVCGYVDLPPGKHRLHAHVAPGAGETAVSPKLLVYELGAQTGSWYASFGLSCGDASECTLDELSDKMKSLHRKRGLFDPCGSVKVRATHWNAAKAADQRVTSFDLDLVLEVYRFAPRLPRGSACTKHAHE